MIFQLFSLADLVLGRVIFLSKIILARNDLRQLLSWASFFSGKIIKAVKNGSKTPKLFSLAMLFSARIIFLSKIILLSNFCSDKNNVNYSHRE